MLFRVKKVISPRKAKFVSTFAVGTITMVLVWFCASIVMDSVLKRVEKRYKENCSHILEGYSNAIYFYLENYHTSLSSIYHSELFATGNNDEIHEWLIENVPFVHKDFCTVFYVDMDTNIGYFSQKSVLDLTGRPYINASFFEKSNYYVSDIYYSEYSDYPVFIIEEPYFDKTTHKLKGILCAALKLDVLEVITNDIRIGEESTAYIMDRDGHLLIHPDLSYIGKIFVPKAEKYRGITSDVTAKEGNGVVETENHLGEPIDLFYVRIQNCDWVLGVGFPKKYLKTIYSQQNKARLMIISISVAALILLLILEMSISDYFYSNQLIDAVYDPLTKLWTRERFVAQAEKIIRHSPRGKFMLIESDIRGLKVINQNYGMEDADKMIFFFSGVLNKVTKEQHGIIGRGYADQFMSFIRISDVRTAMTVFRRVLDIVMDECKNYEIPFFPKFGITFYRPENAREIQVKQLISQAAFAKTSIKDDMLKNFAIYNSRLLNQANEIRSLELNMEAALENNEFFVVYQPKISLESDKIVGAEALVRWKTADRGILAPDSFIPLFEQNGFIIKLDFYVYEKVFQFLDRQLKAGEKVVPISVNMSRNHNKPEKFMRDFMEIFRKYDIPPHLVQVEILERSIMDSSTLCETTNRLHREGFTVAMDDFGSGESSLTMLTKVPVDVLKFDRQFLLSSMNEEGGISKRDAEFIQGLIDLSKHLEKETVFEGVETKLQRDFLRSISCDQVQGYFYSKPLTEQDFVTFLEEHL